MSTSLAQLLARFDLSKVGSFINGEVIPGSGDEVTLVNPVNGETLLSYASADQNVVAQAVESAERWARAARRCMS